MRKDDIKIDVQKNFCAGCGKEFQQAACITQFGVIIQRYCDECIEKEDRKEKAIEKQQEEGSVIAVRLEKAKSCH